MSDPSHPTNREAQGVRDAIEAVLIAELRERQHELGELRAAAFDVQIVPVGEHLGAELPLILVRIDWPAGDYLARPRRATYRIDGFSLPALLIGDAQLPPVKTLAGVALFGTYPPAQVGDPRGLAQRLRCSEDGRRRLYAIACNAAAVYLFGADVAEGGEHGNACRVEDDPGPIER